MRISSLSLPLVAGLSLACASTPSAPPAPAPGPGPMRPHAPDTALDAAPPVDITDELAMRAWITERIAKAKAGDRERVRLPVVRHAMAFGCDCPDYAIAPSVDNGPFYWLSLADMTSAGIPPGEWLGWVDGRFTGALHTYQSTHQHGDEGTLTNAKPPVGTTVETPVFEVLRQRKRSLAEAPEARFVPDTN